MDELHEAMLTALEAARPKADQKADKLTIEEVMGMSEADLQATLLSTGPSHQVECSLNHIPSTLNPEP